MDRMSGVLNNGGKILELIWLHLSGVWLLFLKHSLNEFALPVTQSVSHSVVQRSSLASMSPHCEVLVCHCVVRCITGMCSGEPVTTIGILCRYLNLFVPKSFGTLLYKVLWPSAIACNQFTVYIFTCIFSTMPRHTANADQPWYQSMCQVSSYKSHQYWH